MYPWHLQTKYLELLQEGRAEYVVSRYMQYPKKDITEGVIQYHLRGKGVKDLTSQERKALANASWKDIENPSGLVKSAVSKTTGCSVHEDWRLSINGHLVGWSAIGLEWTKKLGPSPKKVNIGYRFETKCFSEYCNEWQYELIDIDEENTVINIEYIPIEELSKKTLEELARQPKEWLKVKGFIPPGKVGAAKIEAGFFVIKARLKVVFGAQKPLFHEYFVLGGPFDKWTRMIIRGVRVKRIDPDTKKPIPGKYELLWRGMVPSDETPYAISSRARKKEWIPPKGIIPVPPTWKKTDKYKEWIEWVKEQWKTKKKGTEKMAKTIPFVLHMISAMGPVHVRGVPNIEWYVRLKTAKGIRSFYVDGNPLREHPLGAFDIGRVSPKMFDYEGKLSPDDPYNPFGFKKLKADVSILDKGSVEYATEEIPEEITLKFKGKKLKGTWLLKQTEKGSDAYSFEKLSKEELEKTQFVLHRHYWKNKEHWDIRVKRNDYLTEWNLWNNPLNTKTEEPIRSLKKKCYDIGWFITKGKGIKKKVGGLQSNIDVLDTGNINIIEDTDRFMSMKFFGKRLKGYWVLKKEKERWQFIKSILPKPTISLQGDPIQGKPFKPFIISKKKGWDYYWVYLYNMKEFTRCVSEKKARELYLEGISIPNEVIDILVCLASRPGTLPLARVAALKINDKWSEEQAFDWIKRNGLSEWSHTMIRGRRKTIKGE